MDISIEFWHWLVIGVAFLALEVLAPGAILMWFGFGGIITGIVLWLIPTMPVEMQILIFSIFSVVSIFVWRKYMKKGDEEESDTPDLNNRLNTYIGKQTVLKEAIQGGVGLAKVGDSAWKVMGDDMPAGTRVKIVAVEGVFFRVEAVE